MGGLDYIKKLQKFQLGAAAKPAQLRLRRSPDESNSGFTMLELIVVVMIIAILSAIAAPGWLAFTNRQRVAKVNDAVMTALQEAQREAKRTKLSYSVSFANVGSDLNSAVTQFVVYPTPTDTAPIIPQESQWKKVSENQDIKPGSVLLGANLTGTDTTNNGSANLKRIDPITTIPTSKEDLLKQPTITFDYMGNLSAQPNKPNFGPNNRGLIIAVALNNSGQVGRPQRCVIVKTLLGAMQTGQDDQCNP